MGRKKTLQVMPTQEELKRLPKLGATDGASEKIAQVRWFGPGRWAWYAVEFDGEDQFFGYVMSGLGSDCDEWGYFSLAELAANSQPRVMPGKGLVGAIERDEHWKPQLMSQVLVRLREHAGTPPERILFGDGTGEEEEES